MITASGFCSPRLPLLSDVNEADLNVVVHLKGVEQAQPHAFELYDYNADIDDTQFILLIKLKLTELLLARLWGQFPKALNCGLTFFNTNTNPTDK